MYRKPIINIEQREENIFWITMSDLLLGLVIIFLTLFIMAMVGYTQSRVQEQSAQSELAEELAGKFNEQNIPVQIDKLSGIIKISDLELFKVGSYELSPNGKAYLQKVIPIYINTIFSNKKLNNRVVNIIVEGHTDSQMFKGLKSKDEQFIKNLELSTLRANSVATYVFKTDYNKKHSPTLHKVLVVEGKSYTNPILTNGNEDFDKSRRVELKIHLKKADFIDKFLIKETLLTKE